MVKVAIVIGGSRGIGAACVRRLAGEGFKVAVFARSEETDKIAAEVGGFAYKGSIGSQKILSAFVSKVNKMWGRIDVVVNSTGHAPRGKLLQLQDKDWQVGFEMYFLHVVRMARLVTPIMEKQGAGSIINISSFAALEPTLDYPISSAIRAALANYVKLYSNEYSRKGIRMNNVLPGFVDSYPVDGSVIEKIPAGREATTSEIAGVVAFLASDDASYIHGENIKVDGGLSKGF